MKSILHIDPITKKQYATFDPKELQALIQAYQDILDRLECKQPTIESNEQRNNKKKRKSNDQ